MPRPHKRKVILFQHPANAFASATSGELCGLRISAQVVIDPFVKLGVERKILRVPGETITP